MTEEEKETWAYLGISLLDQSRSKLIARLGFDSQTIESLLNDYKNRAAQRAEQAEPEAQKQMPEEDSPATDNHADEPSDAAGLFGENLPSGEGGDVAGLFSENAGAEHDDPFSSISTQANAPSPFTPSEPADLGLKELTASSPASILELARQVKDSLDLGVRAVY